MKKKILSVILNIFLCTGLCHAAGTQIDTIKGINQLEKKMTLNFINKLQATADNDGLTFSSLWPDEYFYNDGRLAYLYVVANNSDDSLELVLFNINKNNEECFKGENPNFCIPNISPVIEKFDYGKRFIMERTPNFIDNMNETEKMEVLVKDGVYFDTKYITRLKPAVVEETYQKCNFNDDGTVEKCQTFNKKNDDLIYTEELYRKQDLSDNNHVYKYTKYSHDGNKIEEYFYSSGKHIRYSKDGEIKTFSQFNEDKFKFYDTDLPDLYVETIFIRDDKGRVIEEQVYDRNHKLVRDYKAVYKKEDLIDKIIVNDFINSAGWTILPIGINDIVNLPFKIRM